MKNLINLICISFITIFCMNAQNYTRSQEFAVMNPNSYEIPRFGLAKINQYTGKADLNFPMFSINLAGKEIPFSLSYDTGGVRVSQESSWVGLGWNLTGIPIIAHQINQKSDIGNKDHPSTGYCYEPKLPNGTETEELNYFSWVSSGAYIGPYREPDTQPDLFIANLIGSTVQFQLTQKTQTGNIQALILNDSNAIVTFNENNQNFTIRDEDGYVYEFTHIEYTTTWSEPAGSSLYEEDRPEQITGQFGDTNYNNEYERFIPSSWYVDRITSPDGEELEFKYEYESDGKPNVTLSHPIYYGSTKVTTCLRLNGGNLGNEFNFGNLDDITASRTIQEIMVLDEIVHKSSGNKWKFKTSPRLDLFSYNNTTTLAGFSGYGNNYDPIPKKLHEIEVISLAGKSIKRIEFQQSYFDEFKINDLNNKSYLRLKLDGFRIFDQQYAFKYNCADALPEKHSMSTDFWGFYNGHENTRRVPYVKFDSDVCTLENPDVINSNIEIDGAIKGSSYEHALIGSLREVRYPTGGTTIFEYEKNTVTMDIGNTELTADHFNFPYLFQHNLEPDYPKSGMVNQNLKIVPVGGLRVNTILNLGSNGDPLLKKSYLYEEQKSNGDVVSSGRLMDAIGHYKSVIQVSQNAQVLSNLIISSGNVFGSNGSAMGSHIGYGRVVELSESADGLSNNGKVVSFFINEPNESLRDEGNGIKFAVETNPMTAEHLNGKITRQEIWDGSNFLKQVTDHTYRYDSIDFPIGYKVFYSFINGLIADVPITNKLVTDFYHFTPRKYIALLTESTAREYLNGVELTSRTFNTYNAKDRLSSTERIGSRGTNDLIRTEFYYPYDTDYGVNSFLISGNLSSLNQINAPLYKRYYNNGSLVGHELTKYSDFIGKTKPIGAYFSKSDTGLGSMDLRVQYDRYDSYGNLTQYRLSNGIPISAIWGYNGQYIVAKIENVSYGQIENLVAFGSGFEIGNTGLSQVQKESLRSLQNAMVSYYDHDPLVGPTIVSDTRGYETSYTYDNFNRLVTIRDQDSNIVQDYEYALADVQLYPIEEYSECFSVLRILNINTMNNTVQFFAVDADVQGGFGNYQYAWYLGYGSNGHTAEFDLTPSGTEKSFLYEVCCDTEIFIKLVVTDGTQTASRIFSNPNFNHPSCSPTACDNPF
ncbi:hypothetical protein U1E44_08300 [Arenibacter sp. GZD96]|uniref:hypothetical protein n=1 Tax=Aurantibrevibacter litoralis TaxID=3106030 RepID=UPI002AFE75BA|nr:hypothetical protein [Arenibacter sp. GZD-96]MEA1786088.1 hypothetical protein [Arenibacter sp. GZD-96]